jgi:hypothetical protein
MEQKASGFQRIITGDASWFFLYCPSDSVWAASRDELPQRSKHKTGTEKTWFRSFDQLTESTVFLISLKLHPTTQRSSLMLQCPV